ncbi:hypothetical protein KC330_g8758, partial [Hortaea werneckii]
MKSVTLFAGCLINLIGALELNIDDEAYGMMKWYNGNETGYTPGILPEPHYWWEAGAMWGALIDYWSFVRVERPQFDITNPRTLLSAGLLPYFVREPT